MTSTTEKQSMRSFLRRDKHRFTQFFYLWLGVAFLFSLAVWSSATSEYQKIVEGQNPRVYYRFSDQVLPSAFLHNQGSVSLTNRLFHPARWSSLPVGAVSGDRAVSYDGVGVCSDYDEELNPWPYFSVEFWAQYGGTQPEVNGYGSPLGNFSRGEQGGRGWTFYVSSNGVWEFHLGGAQNVNCILRGGAARLEEWAYLVATYDGALVQLYVDGVLADSAVFYGAVPNSPLECFGIGCRGDGFSPWTGGLDEVALHAEVLTAAQIAEHYSLREDSSAYEKALLSLKPRLYLRMNELQTDHLARNSAPKADSGSGDGAYWNGAAPSALGPAYECFETGNKALCLTNRADYFELSLEKSLGESSSYTLCGWVCPFSLYHLSAHPAREILFAHTDADNPQGNVTIFLHGEGYLSCSLGDRDVFEPGILIQKNIWSYLALRVQPQGICLWVSDGSEGLRFLENSSGSFPLNWSGRFRLGAEADSYIGLEDFNFYGELDEWAFFDRALSEGEIKRQFYSAWSGIPPEVFGIVCEGSPASPISLRVGESVTLRADAAGSLPLSFQWFRNGIPIPEAHEECLTCVLNDPGTEHFEVEVSNREGSVKSSVFEIQVTHSEEPPQLTYLWKEGVLELDWKGGTLCSFTQWGQVPLPVPVSQPPLKVKPVPGENRFYIVVAP